MATGDAFLSQGGLHGGDGRGENVRLLKHLRRVWPIQRAEDGAVVKLHSFVKFDYRELIPASLCAPVFILTGETRIDMDNITPKILSADNYATCKIHMAGTSHLQNAV